MKKLLTLFAVFSAYTVLGQINYEPGYYIDNAGKRTDGLIKNVAWKDTPSDFEFKTTESDNPQRKQQKDITEFAVGDYRFRRFDVSIDLSPTIISHLSTRPNPEWERMTAFFRVLVEGKVMLYEYSKPNLVKYFFSTGSHDNAEQLMYREYQANGDIKKNNLFRQQLYNLMKDSKAESEFEKLRYNRSDLTNLFNSYNGAGGNTKDYTTSKSSGGFHVKLTAGVAMASLSATASVSGYNYDFDSETVFRAGAEAEYVLPFNNNKWAIFIAPYYETYSSEGETETYRLTAKYSSVSIPLGVRHYMFLNEKSKFFLNAAYILPTHMGDSYLLYENKNFDNPLKFDFGNRPNLALGAGYAYGPFIAELQYGLKRELLNYSSRSAAYQTFGLIIGYNIF